MGHSRGHPNKKRDCLHMLVLKDSKKSPCLILKDKDMLGKGLVKTEEYDSYVHKPTFHKGASRKNKKCKDIGSLNQFRNNPINY